MVTGGLPATWVVALLAVSTAAAGAQAQTDAEPQEPAPDTAPEPGPDDADIGPIETRVGSADDVLQQLDRAERARTGVFKTGPINLLYPHWQSLNDTLDAQLGLRLGFTYYLLFQYTTPGPSPRTAAAGDLDFFGRWALLKGEDRARGVLGFNLEYRHALTDIPPSQLNLGIGSIWRTTRGFTDSGFNFNELWWDQRLANDRISLRLGTINQKHFYDLHRFKSQKRFFLSTPLSDSPTIAFPQNGLGAKIRVSPLEWLHVTAGIGDANGERRVGGFDTFFGDGEFFTALDVAVTPTFEGLGDGRYSVTIWNTDARTDAGTPSGHGFSALIEQEIAEGVAPFARYGYGDGANLPIEHFAALGVGIEGPFGAVDDVAGVGASWGRPPGADPRDQWGLEVFYRFQLTPVIEVTPGVQLIVDPSFNPDEDVVGVFELRIGLVF